MIAIRYIRAVLTSLLLLTGTAAGQSLSVQGRFTVPNSSAELKPIPRWHYGYLTRFEDGVSPAKLMVFDRSGKMSTQAELTFAPYIRVRDIAVSPSGRVAVAGSARDATSTVHFIAWLSASGSVEFIVRSDPFGAELLTFATDGSLWVFGGQNTRQSHPMLHQYGVDGKLIKSTLPSSTVWQGKGLHPALGAFMTATDGRIGIAMKYAGLWVEVSTLDGGVTGQWPLPPNSDRQLSAGMTTSGRVYLELENTDVTGVSVFTLDKQSGHWRPVDISPVVPTRSERWMVHILGGDGENVVMTNNWLDYVVMRPNP
jgi:hypothetical protein